MHKMLHFTQFKLKALGDLIYVLGKKKGVILTNKQVTFTINLQLFIIKTIIF